MATVAAVLIAVGILTALAGAIWAWTTEGFSEGAVSVPGTVVALHEEYGGGSPPGYSWFPVVGYRVDGRPHQFTSGIGAAPPAFEVGEAVTVLVDPADPTKARIAAFQTLWLGPLILVIVGVIGVIVGLVLLGLRRRLQEASGA